MTPPRGMEEGGVGILIVSGADNFGIRPSFKNNLFAVTRLRILSVGW